MGWTGDAHMTTRSQLFNFDSHLFFEKYMDDHDANQGPGGSQTDTIPHAYGSRPADPNWARTRVTIPWFLYLHSGDRRILSEHYEGMKAYLDFWSRTAEDHRPRRGEPLRRLAGPRRVGDKQRPALLNTFAHYQTTDLLARLAETLGEADDAERYRSRAEAFNDDSSIPTRERTAAAIRRPTRCRCTRVSSPTPTRRGSSKGSSSGSRRDDGKIGTGFVGTRPLLFTLVEHGHADLAYHLVSQPEEPGWVFMVRNGATTHWSGGMPRTTARTSTPQPPQLDARLRWLYRTLAGIDIVEPGFERVSISPHLVGDLDHAGGSVDTVRGEVHSRWERTDDGLRPDVSVPGNATAVVRIPTLGEDRVREGGKNVWTNGHPTGIDRPGIDGVKRDGDRITVGIESGEYWFELGRLTTPRSAIRRRPTRSATAATRTSTATAERAIGTS